jgi:glucosamine--fructose-6-phosphate aminotransferase (isomerizing)
MCGIFGYVGNKKNAAQVIHEGLKRLEYRGYDSWGIATNIKNQKSTPIKSGSKIKNLKSESGFVVEKHVGRILNRRLVSKLLKSDANLGIGHTRWATHGGVTIANAHPHLDCKNEIAVVHNGIIENFLELKEQLIKKGHVFVSKTDTEVVPHLIEENLTHPHPNPLPKGEGGGEGRFTGAVLDAFNKLKGINAIVVAYSPSYKIVAAKTGSPLVVGIGKNELFVASDAIGILRHTKKVLFLKDNEMAVLGNKVDLFSLRDGKKKNARFETINWKIEDVDKGKYKHFMMKEIFEEPSVLRNIAQNYTQEIESLARSIEKAKGTFFIGAGTAFHACLAGVYLFSEIAHKHVNTAVASEFNYLEHFLTKESLVIALSQSGETIDVIEPLVRAKKKGSKIVAITNSLGSTIYRMADSKILLGAGPEKAVASTKAYVAKLGVVLMLAFAMKKNIEKAKSYLLKISHEIDRILRNEELKKIKQLAKILSSMEHIYTIGRGVSFATALEAALKIKEVSYIHTEGLAGGELKHGTIALITKGTPCIVFAPNDATYDAIISNAAEIKARGGIIIGIGSKYASIFDYWIEVKDFKEASLIAQIVPAQVLAYYLALEKGHDPDKPRNLAKSVTVK